MRERSHERSSSPGRLPEVFEIRDVRVLDGLLLEQRKEPRQGRAETIGPFVILPVDRDAASEALFQPPDDVVGVVGRDRGPDDSRDLGMVEGRQVRAGGRELRDTRAEGRKDGFGKPQHGP